MNAGFLEPFQSSQDSSQDIWKELQSSGLIRVRDTAAAKRLLERAENWNVTKQSELCLVLVEAFRNRFLYELMARRKDKVKYVAQKMFQGFIFGQWEEQTMNWINRSIESHELPPENAVQLLRLLLLFIGEHEDIQNQKHLQDLVENRSVNLPAVLATVSYRLTSIQPTVHLFLTLGLSRFGSWFIPSVKTNYAQRSTWLSIELQKLSRR
jgi:hypothetical protein